MILYKTARWRCAPGDIYWCRLWCNGKTQIMVWERFVTFRWEVGFALGFVGPVDHQVPIATETVGDFICKNKESRVKKRKKNLTWLICSRHDKITFMSFHTICIGGTVCGAAAGAETGTVSIFCHVPAAVVATALNRNTGRAHPVCTGLTRAVETHEFFSRLRARIVHPLMCSFTCVDADESKLSILTLNSGTCSRACGNNYRSIT